MEAHRVARLDWRTIFTTPTESVELDVYAQRFAQPVDFETNPCMKCGTRSCGFTYGLVTGCGHCINCGYPARRDHEILGRTVRGVVLQYHPDYVTEAETPDPFTGFRYRVVPEWPRFLRLPGPQLDSAAGTLP